MAIQQQSFKHMAGDTVLGKKLCVATAILFLLLGAACSKKIETIAPPLPDTSAIEVPMRDDPQQNGIDIPDWHQNGYKIHALARYELKARVLSVETYHSDRESDLSPVDFALGWGPMSDEELLKRIDISQGHRWYHWHADSLPMSVADIESHSANTHIVPATKEVEKIALEAKKHDIVKMRGYLIRVDAKDGWHWVSSLSRTDTGAGSCELFWVEKIDIE